MRHARLTAALVAALWAGAAGAATRTLFVGINDYANSFGKNPSAEASFRDLKGAVNDVVMIRNTLATRWQLPLPAFDPAKGCSSAPDALSVTLTDRCATRAAIVSALTGQILAAAEGDTILFFYAGHGAQVEDRTRTQPDGTSSTIVPADARDGRIVDIVDIDLGRLIDAAVARGVNVVTIFDSCNSGTGTRDLVGEPARAAPQTKPGDNADIRPPPPRPHANRAYRVHLAAAADGEVARELTVDNAPHGVFSLALNEALTALDRPAYADVLEKVRSIYAARQLAQQPDTRLAEQTIGGEGALKALFLGAAPKQQRIVAAAPGTTSTTLALANGTLIGVTIGSAYRVYGSTGDAVRGDPDAALGEGIVSAADIGSAVLTLAAPLKTRTTGLQALEIAHVSGGAPVRLSLLGGEAAARAEITRLLADFTALKVTSDAPDYLLVAETGGWQLRSRSDVAIGTLIKSDELGVGIPDIGRKLVQYFTLLSLPNAAGMAAVKGDAEPMLTFTYDCDDRTLNPPLPMIDGAAAFVGGERMAINFTNGSGAARYAYLFHLSQNLAIKQLATEADLVTQGTTLLRRGIRAGKDPGTSQILLLLTASQIDVSVLEQSGVRSLMSNPLERLLAGTRNGQASRNLDSVGTFAAHIATVRVLPTTSPSGARATCTFNPRP
ncbi:MAG: hypothetical protein CFE37_12200 [Alphaproteobacteria bacterium PA4]|nr:MAG: hypothetical protein CFE37_12200 [Alphaproteobacteria bacterium PA4]